MAINNNKGAKLREIFGCVCVPTTPTPPSGEIDLNVTSGSAILNWSYTDTNQDGFNIEKSTDGDVYTPLTILSNPSLRTYTDEVVSEGNTYWYRLNAYNTAGTSSYSNTGSIYFDAPPAVPHLLAYNGASVIFDYTDTVISSSYNGIINITSSNLTSVTASNCTHLTYLYASYNPLSEWVY